MFEVASGSGSTSSDSIVNISHSGASSISTSHSTTTTTTTTIEDELKTEINKLREDKKILEGRIRGFRTLSDLLVDTRKENDQLKSQMQTLTMSLQTLSSGADRQMSASSPFSLVSMQAAQQSQSDGNMSLSGISQLTQVEQKIPSFIPLTKNVSAMDPKGPPVAHPPVSGPPSSLQETVGPPGDSKEMTLIPVPSVAKSTTKPAPDPAKESMPKQESLESGSEQHLSPTSSPLTAKVSHPESLTSESSSPELLQLDSDKYDEATYEKIGLQLAMGHAGLTTSMYAAGGSGAESRPTDFPSLSSGMSNGMAQPPSHVSVTNPPYMAMMHQSLSELTLNKPGTDLAMEVENITERLHSEPADSMPAIAFQMHQIAERISEVEQKKRNQKKLIDALMGENQELKRRVKMGESALQAEIVALKEENRRLMQQLKGQRPDEQSTTVKSSGSQGDWVHVEKPSQMGESAAESDRSFVDRVRRLEHDKAELMRANSNWKNQWDQMERNHQIKMNEMHSKAMLGEQELATLKSRLAEQMSEFEGRMLEMKRRIGEEENLKEEAQHQQRLAERRCSELQDQLTELRTQLSDTAREKQALSSELSILKAHTTGQDMQTSSAAGATNAASRSALEAEIAMLKEQLKVFAEDFEQERLDRTSAQAARDSAKKNAEAIARQTQSLSSQVKHQQKQIKDRDDTISWTLRQNETLQRQAADYKKKLAGEWEEKQNLQRRVLLLEQQVQQQPVRNPYLSTEPTTTFNQIPVHQPPPPPRMTAPYFGAQGAAAPSRNRPVGGMLSPEHLPGAWTCAACTYINYPGRTVCESCGYVNARRNHPEQFGFASHDMYGSEHALLMSRGADQNQGGLMPGNGDLVVDSGTWTTAPI